MQNSSYGHSPPTETLPLFQDPAYCRFPWSFPFSLWLEPASPLVELLLQFFAFLRRQIMSASCHDCRLSTSVRAVLRSPGKESPGVGESLCSNAHSSGCGHLLVVLSSVWSYFARVPILISLLLLLVPMGQPWKMLALSPHLKWQAGDPKCWSP